MTTTTPDGPSLRTAAAKYASLGYAIIPLHWIKPDGSCSCNLIDCDKEGKHPLGQHGASDPMTNPEIVSAQWDKYPKANIGIVAGASGLCIVDLDSETVRDYFVDIADIDTVDALNTTPISKTGKGWHLVFRDPSGDYGPSVGKNQDKGIDIRAGVSYIVAPPSQHKNGTTYEWIQNAPPREAPLVTPWLHDYITTRTPKKDDTILEDDAIIESGSRNQMLFELGYSMRRKGFTREAIEAALLTMNATRVKPPLSTTEIISIAKSCASYQPQDVPLLMPTISLDELVEEKKQSGEPRYRFLNETEIAALPPIDYLVDKLIPRGGYGITYGRRGSYKTFDAIDLALSICTGQPYHGLDTHGKTCTVAYIMSEGSASLNKRVKAWKQSRGIDHVPGFYALPTSVPLPDPNARAELGVAIDALPNKPDLIIIDTLARSIPGLDENKSQDMTTFIGIIDELRERYGAAVNPVHHAGWNSTHERGSTVIGDAADWIMAISKSEDGEKITCKVEKVKDEETPDDYRCTFLPIAGTGSGILAHDNNVPADPDLELIFLHYYGELSQRERDEGVAFTRLVAASNTQKTAQRIRQLRNLQAELDARNLRLVTRGTTNAYYLESAESVAQFDA